MPVMSETGIEERESRRGVQHAPTPEKDERRARLKTGEAPTSPPPLAMGEARAAARAAPGGASHE
eukprot:4695670-Prymnesium_polylepis.1